MSEDRKNALEKKEFRKANEIITPRVVRGGTMTLLSRKVFNVLLYHTQRLGKPGKDAPESDPQFASFFWIPLRELAADASYNSEDVAVLKDALQRLQDIKIVIDDSSGFASDVLIPNIRIIPQGRGRPVMVGWKLDEATERILLTPELYTRLSMYYLTSLKSTASIALYEVAKRYSTNPSGLTMRQKWEWWHDVLTGLPMSHEKPEYKYFKRDTLKPAIDEVNTTDIRVELIEHKNGRRIEQLQFGVTLAAQQGLELPPPPVINTKMVEEIHSLGIHVKDAEDIFATHDESLIAKTLGWVRQRMTNKNLPPVESPAALFRAALRGRYALQQGKPVGETKRLTQTRQEVNENQEGLVKRKAALQAFNALPEDRRLALLADFAAALKGPVAKAYAKHGLDHPLTGPAFVGWLMAKSAQPS